MNNIDTTQKHKVLVIDDNKGILFCLQQALTLKGYEVSISETYDGIEFVKKIAPDIMYLDVSLVGQDGREVSRELKEDAATKHIPIIILTAYPNADDLSKEAGANDYLSKPFDLEELWAMTRKYIDTSRSARDLSVPITTSAIQPNGSISEK